MKLSEIIDKLIAINCDTLEQVSALMHELEERGYLWCSREKPTEHIEDYWNDYKSQTCYHLMLNPNNQVRVGYNSVTQYKSVGYTIVSYDDIVFDK